MKTLLSSCVLLALVVGSSGAIDNCVLGDGTVTLEVYDCGGGPLAGATVAIEVYTPDGHTLCETVSGTTNNFGVVTVALSYAHVGTELKVTIDPAGARGFDLPHEIEIIGFHYSTGDPPEAELGVSDKRLKHCCPDYALSPAGARIFYCAPL